MTDIDDVTIALAARIATGMTGTPIAGRSFGYAVDSPNPPCAIVLPSDGQFVSFDATMDGRDDYELVVKLLVGTAMSRTAQAMLQGFLARSGTGSVRAAIYGDKTLGGLVSDLLVVGARSYGDVDYAGVTFFGAELVVSIWG